MMLMSKFFISNASAGNTFETYGDIGQIAIPVSALIMTAVHDDKEGRSQFIKAFVATTAVTYVMKYSINATRPNGGDHSFPSGHTSSAFSGASFIQQRYGMEYGIPAYIAASLVGASRVTSNNHYIKDVVAGAAIGISTNLILTEKYNKKTIAITPINLNRGWGMLLTYRQ